MDGTTKRLPYNCLTHTVLDYQSYKSYAEGNIVLLLGRILGHKRDDIKLLPSSCSEKVCIVKNIDYNNYTNVHKYIDAMFI